MDADEIKRPVALTTESFPAVRIVPVPVEHGRAFGGAASRTERVTGYEHRFTGADGAWVATAYCKPEVAQMMLAALNAPPQEVPLAEAASDGLRLAYLGTWREHHDRHPDDHDGAVMAGVEAVAAAVVAHVRERVASALRALSNEPLDWRRRPEWFVGSDYTEDGVMTWNTDSANGAAQALDHAVAVVEKALGGDGRG